MTVLAALLAGVVAGWLLLRTASAVLFHPVLRRSNYRGAQLPTAAGLVVVAAALAVEGGRALLGMFGVGDPAAPARVTMLAAVTAFGFLGMMDDLLGDADDRGLRGHIGAALRGRVTTGFVKLGGGAAAALVLSGFINGNRPGRVLVDAAVIALAANLGNLLDRAPGRTLKWAVLAYIPLGAAGGSSEASTALAVVIGAGLALAAGDVRERFMLGDTGANALGAALGVTAVLVTAPQVRTVVAVALVLLTLLSEVVSLSRIIEAVPPLRGLDRLGRLPRKERN
ncbi:MAG: hypothetical protein WD602_11050 [Actinomycetota bacterium]